MHIDKKMDRRINIVIFELNYITNKQIWNFIERIKEKEHNIQILVGFHSNFDKEVECLYGENIKDVII